MSNINHSESKSTAIVHPLHAWEEVVEEYQDGELSSSCTIIKLWTPFCKNLQLDLEKSNTFHMIEYTIDPNTNTISQEVIDDTINSEFATMPPKPVHLSTAGTPQSFHTSQPSDELEAFPRAKISTVDGTMKELKSTLSIHDRYGYTAIFGDNGNFIGK